MTGNESPWERRKICVIDDDSDIREIYRMKLSLEGFEVSTAENGEVGMRVVRETRPEVILLDIQMPVKNGLDVLAELKQDPELSRIPVIVLSNVDDEAIFKEVGKFETRFYAIKSLTTPDKVAGLVREVLH